LDTTVDVPKKRPMMPKDGVYKYPKKQKSENPPTEEGNTGTVNETTRKSEGVSVSTMESHSKVPSSDTTKKKVSDPVESSEMDMIPPDLVKKSRPMPKDGVYRYPKRPSGDTTSTTHSNVNFDQQGTLKVVKTNEIEGNDKSRDQAGGGKKRDQRSAVPGEIRGEKLTRSDTDSSSDESEEMIIDKGISSQEDSEEMIEGPHPKLEAISAKIQKLEALLVKYKRLEAIYASKQEKPSK
jgi:hypothetical protein